MTSMDTNVIYTLIRAIRIVLQNIRRKAYSSAKKGDWDYLVDYCSHNENHSFGWYRTPENRRQDSKEDVVTKFKAMKADGDRRDGN